MELLIADQAQPRFHGENPAYASHWLAAWPLCSASGASVDSTSSLPGFRAARIVCDMILFLHISTKCRRLSSPLQWPRPCHGNRVAPHDVGSTCIAGHGNTDISGNNDGNKTCIFSFSSRTIHRTWSPDGSLRQAVLLAPLQHDSIIALEDLQRILDHYCAAIGMDMSTLPAMMQDRQDARYGFNLTVPSATWWQRLWRRDRLRIACPYV
jgi:hypothetical protein